MTICFRGSNVRESFFSGRTIFGGVKVSGSTSSLTVNDRKYVFHFRPKPKPDKHLALGRIPKPKPKVQIYVKIGGILLKFNVSND